MTREEIQAKQAIDQGFVNNSKLDVGALRPFVGIDGMTYITMYKRGNDKKDPVNPKNPKNYVAVPVQTNGTLRRDEWKQLDDSVLTVARERLGGIDDLINANLTYQLGNAMGTTVLEWHDVSDSQEADLTMDGISRGRADRPKFQYNYLPVPIIHVDFQLNMRELEASRKLGNPLDTTSAEHAARKVNEKLESMLFTNTSYSFGTNDERTRNTIYSYLSHPDRNQETLAQNWDASGKTAAEIKTDVINMKQASINAKHYGPWMLYIPTAYETVLDDDYDTTTPGQSIRERLLKISGIQGIKVIDTLTANNVLLVQMTSNVVRLVQGMGIQTVEWDSEGRFVTNYKVMTIQVPQIRSDQNGKTGIVHLS